MRKMAIGPYNGNCDDEFIILKQNCHYQDVYRGLEYEWFQLICGWNPWLLIRTTEQAERWRLWILQSLQGIHVRFLPARRYARAGNSCRNVSVWLSVTAGIVSKRKQLASWFLHHLITHWYRSLMSYDSSKNFQGVTLSEGDLWEWGGFERAIFRPINRRISETVQDTTKVTIEH